MNDERMDGNDSQSDEDLMSEVQKRHQETADMNKILDLVTPFNRSTAGSSGSQNPIELGSLEQELEKIKQNQDNVIRQLEQASLLGTSPEHIPPVLSRIVGTWKTISVQDPSSASISYFPPAFLFGFMWYKLEGYNLHCCFFNGLDHEKSVDTIGVECDGELDGSKKMTYIEEDRLITSHRMIADGSEFMRIERFIVDGRLHFVFQRNNVVCTRIYERVFRN